MVDYCADDISSQEAKILIEYIQEKLGSEIFHFLSWRQLPSLPGVEKWAAPSWYSYSSP